MEAEQLRAWVDTMERLARTLPADTHYTHIENFNDIKRYLETKLKAMERSL